MSEVEMLADLLRAAHQDLELSLDQSAEPEASAWLDVERQGRIVSVEWRPRRGFGVSLLETSEDPRAGLFEGPDEIVSDAYIACDRVLSLLGVDASVGQRLRAARH